MAPADYDAYVKKYVSLVRAAGHEPVYRTLDAWRTPASDYPRERIGRARIRRIPYVGRMMCYGSGGVDFVTFPRRVLVTTLEVDGKCWMVDDPPHWWSIQETAKKLSGRVLVGGLGLGLILHAMADNPLVESAVVVEREHDVIDLLRPNLPPGLEAEIVETDFLDYIESAAHFDSAFVDLWVTQNFTETQRTLAEEVIPLATRIRERTGAPMYTLGFSGSEPTL